MNVTVIFNADTGQYEAKLAGLDAKTAKSAQAVADAKNKILAYHQEQIQSAVKLGKSAEDLERIQSKSAAAMANVTETNANKIIASIERIRERNAKMRSEMEGSLKLPVLPPAPETHGHPVSDRMAVSAVTRLTEGNVGIRPVENFIASIGGGGLAQSLFPIIGGGALAAMFVDLGEKVYDFDQKMHNAARSIHDAWDEVNSSTHRTGIELDITRDKLDMAIAKLEHKPENGLRLAIDEDRKAMADLAGEAIRARKEIDGLFKEQGVSNTDFIKSVGLYDLKQLLQAIPGLKGLRELQGGVMMPTDEDQKFADDQARTLARVGRMGEDRLTGVTSDAERKRITDVNRNQEIMAAQKAVQDTYDRLQGVYRKREQTPIADFSARTEALEGLLQQRRDELANLQKGFGVTDASGTKDRLESQKEAATQAAEQQMKSIEDANARLKAKFATDHAAMLGAEVAFWQAMANSSKILPANQARVLDQYANAEQAYSRALIEFARQGAEDQKREKDAEQKTQRDGWDKDFQGWMDAGQRSAQAIADYWSIRVLEAEQGSQNELDAERKANDALKQVFREREQLDQAKKRAALEKAQRGASLDETKLQIAQRTGRISPQDAAVELQQIHRTASDAQIVALQDAYDRQKSKDAQFGPDYESAETINALAALNRAKAEQMAQDQVDAARVAATGWKDSLTDAIDVWYQHAKDTAGQVAQLFDQTISETNRNLVDLVSGDYKKGDFTKEGHDLFKTVAGDALEQAEASLLGGLGLGKGKPDGTANNPYHVVFGGDQSSDSSSGGLMSLVRGIFKKGTTDDSSGDDSGGGLFGSLFGGSSGDDGFGGLAELFGSFGSTGAASGIGDAVAGGASDMIGGALGFLGGFALGGDVPETGIVDVGEMGREKVILPGGSRVVPNHELGGDTHIHIDARDAADPAQTEARLHRAIQSYIPGIVGASLAAQREKRLRTPSTKR